MPSVLTSRQWQGIQQDKENNKIQMEEEKTLKKQKRDEARIEKESEKLLKKIERDKKKKQQTGKKK